MTTDKLLPCQELHELKSCPFCGARAAIDEDGEGSFDVACTQGNYDCGARIENFTTPEYARKAWNTRATATTQLPDAEAQSREIALLNDVEAVTAKFMNAISYKKAALAVLEAIRPYLRTSQPAPVSLEKCAIACSLADSTSQPLPEEYSSMGEYYRVLAKAVLDAAGVAYVKD